MFPSLRGMAEAIHTAVYLLAAPGLVGSAYPTPDLPNANQHSNKILG